MKPKSPLLFLFLVVLCAISCRRNALETLIKVELTYVETGKPVAHAPVLFVTETYEKNDRSLKQTYRDDTLYTDQNGLLSFYKELSDKNDYHYSVRILQGDSNSNSKGSKVIVPGYPNFYSTSVNQCFPVKVFVVHNSASAAIDDAQVYWTYSEFPGSKYDGLKVSLANGLDTSFYIQALNQHTLVFSIDSKVVNPNGGYYYYTRVVRVAADKYSTESIVLLY